jgi:hypothetical protein
VTGVIQIEKRKGEGGEGERQIFINSLHHRDLNQFISPPLCAVAGLDELRLVEVGRGLFLSQAQ